jgi:predicted 3-demethylubiquinone-9 3-methyltransferase (glyoxalase superfamily)
MDGPTAGGAGAKRVFAAIMDMGKIDIAEIEAAQSG